MALNKKQLGQGMTEYIIIVALISVAAIGAYSLFGKTVRNQVAGLANELSGTDAAAEIKEASDAAAAAATTAKVDTNMGDYNETATKAAKSN